MSEDNTQEATTDEKYQARKVKPVGDPEVVQQGTATDTDETPIVDEASELKTNEDVDTEETVAEEVTEDPVEEDQEAVTGEGSEGEADVAGDTAEETTTEDSAVEGSEDQGSDETEETAQTA